MYGSVRPNISLSFFNLQPIAYFVIWLIAKSPWKGAQTTIYCSVAEELDGVSGKYFGNCCEEQLTSSVSVDDEGAERLWEVSMKMVKKTYQ